MRSRIAAMLVMGFTSVMVEVVLVRELLVDFLGNELSVGVILANWLLLEAAGSWLLGRLSRRIRNPVTIYVGLQIAVAALLPLVVAEARIVRGLVGLVPGEGVGFPTIAYLSFLILAPLALLDGAQFTVGCRIFSPGSKRTSSIGFVYVLEAMGSVIGGVGATYVFVPWVPSMASAFLVGIINLLAALLLLLYARHHNHPRTLDRFVAILAAVAIPYIMVSTQAGSIERATLEARWRGYDLIESENSVYGNIAVIGQADQTTFFVDGVPALTSPVPDIELARDLVHITLLSHGSPRKVLIIGGGAGVLISEALRHEVEQIVYVEQDPLLMDLILDLGLPELRSPRVGIEETDGRRFLAQTDEEFDVVLMNLPSPSSLVLNRFYTVEFFRLVSSRMAPGGMLSFPVPGASGYLSEEERRMNKCLLLALKEAYLHSKVVPGTPNIFLASDLANPIDVDAEKLCNLSRSLGLDEVMPCQRIEYLLDESRQAWFSDSLTGTEARANRDLRPSAVFHSLTYWTSIFSPSMLWVTRIVERVDPTSLLLALGAIVLVTLPLRRRLRSMGLLPIPMVVASTGFFGMGFGIMIILSYQSLFGYLYQEIGLVLMAFMLGLSIGGLLSGRLAAGSRKNLLLLEILIILFCLAFLGATTSLAELAGKIVFSVPARLLLLGLSGVSGLLVGAEFSVSSRLVLAGSEDLGKVAGSIYAWDLAGAVVGSLLLSIALVPLLGITVACILVLAVKISSLAIFAASYDLV